jgi:hypothetical protein
VLVLLAEFTKYAVEMGSDRMVYILNSIEIGSDIQKLLRGDMHADTAREKIHAQQDGLIRLLNFP